MTLRPADDAFVASLRKAVSPTVVGDFLPEFREEPRGVFRGSGGVLALPRNTAEVAEIVRRSARAGVAVIPYGGGTGLVGGQVLPEGPTPLVVSLQRMTAIRDIDNRDDVLVVEAGARLSDVHDAAAESGRLFPLSMASEGSCRIGGILATNAGGVHVLRYGSARDLCIGIEAVLPDGSVYHGLRRIRKDNTGYDIRNLLIGSEGTLGIITAATLSLVPMPGETSTGFLTVDSPGVAVNVLRWAREGLGGTLTSFELIHRTGLDFVRQTMPQVRIPEAGESDWFLLVEVSDAAGAGLEDRFWSFLSSQLEDGRIGNAIIASNESQRRELWRFRESIPEANRLTGAIASHDVSVPTSGISDFITRGISEMDDLGSLRVNCFGHLGDGNLHFNVFPPEGRNRAEFSHLRRTVTRRIHDLVAEFEGSISAEHGIGRAKVGELERYGDPAKLAAMAAIKASLDPSGIMNPGAVLRG